MAGLGEIDFEARFFFRLTLILILTCFGSLAAHCGEFGIDVPLFFKISFGETLDLAVENAPSCLESC